MGGHGQSASRPRTVHGPTATGAAGEPREGARRAPARSSAAHVCQPFLKPRPPNVKAVSARGAMARLQRTEARRPSPQRWAPRRAGWPAGALATCARHMCNPCEGCTKSHVAHSCGEALARRSWNVHVAAHMARTCGARMWRARVAMHMARTCGARMWRVLVARACGAHMWRNHVARACGSRARRAHCTRTWRALLISFLAHYPQATASPNHDWDETFACQLGHHELFRRAW